MPYISTTPAKLRNPCTGDQNCTSPFSYKNVLSLTSEGNKFNELVGKQHISGNLDSPEGGFDAIMQVAVCGVSVVFWVFLLFYEMKLFECSLCVSCGWHLNMSPPASKTGFVRRNSVSE